MRLNKKSSPERGRVGFPLVIGITAPADVFDDRVLDVLLITLKKIRERSPNDAFVVAVDRPSSTRVAQAAAQASLPYRSIEIGSGEATAADIALIEMRDVFVFVSSAATRRDKSNDPLSYAQAIDRSVISIDAETGTVVGDEAARSEIDQGWLPQLFQLAGLSPDADLQTVKDRMSALANRAAPLTRRHWKWILLLQGLAALLPLVWLIHRSIAIPVEWVAMMALAAVLVLVTVNWWLRWRGMQKTWARARLVAEVARSLLATAGCPSGAELKIFTLVPTLRPLRWVVRDNAADPTKSSQEWRDHYLENRVCDQEKYFASRQNHAERQRRHLSRWVTLLMDVALAVAFAGAVIAFTPDSRDWIRRFGDVRLEIALGVAGALVPVVLLLIQILRELQELDRRAARYAQQRQTLQQAKARLLSAPSSGAAMEVVNDTEGVLLSEVVDWYFNAETAEHFFSRGQQMRAAHEPVFGKPGAAPKRGLAAKVLEASGIAGLFLLRVILGRVPWIIGSGVAAMAWIAYQLPGDEAEKSKLIPLATLHGVDGKPWVSSPAKAANGCVIIVHGLHGHSLWTLTKEDWMQECAEKIEKRINATGAVPPEICLVNWEGVATPSDIYQFHLFGSETVKLTQDIVMIRPQALEVGEQLGIRLALLVAEGKIRKDRPCYLIGHSAGGFVVARAALTLKKLNLAPAPLYVTILDTPVPNDEVLVDLPATCPTDFYVTSEWGGKTEFGLLATFSGKNMRMRQETPPADVKGELEKHRWAYKWFINTIANPESAPDEGFNRSPLLEQKKTATTP